MVNGLSRMTLGLGNLGGIGIDNFGFCRAMDNFARNMTRATALARSHALDVSTEGRLEHAGLALGYCVPVPAGGRRHEDTILRRVHVCWALERWDATREWRLLLSRREPVCTSIFLLLSLGLHPPVAVIYRRAIVCFFVFAAVELCRLLELSILLFFVLNRLFCWKGGINQTCFVFSVC